MSCLWDRHCVVSAARPSSSPSTLWGWGLPGGRLQGRRVTKPGQGLQMPAPRSNFRLNPGSPPGTEETVLISFGGWTAAPGVCLLITLLAYKAGVPLDSEQPSKEAGRVVGGNACYLYLQDTLGCPASVCVSVCVSEGVSVPACVCHESWDAFAELSAVGRVLEASPRSRQLQPDMARVETGLGGLGEGPEGRAKGTPGTEALPRWYRRETEAESEAGRQRRKGVMRARLGGGDYGPGLPSYKSH